MNEKAKRLCVPLLLLLLLHTVKTNRFFNRLFVPVSLLFRTRTRHGRNEDDHHQLVNRQEASSVFSFFSSHARTTTAAAFSSYFAVVCRSSDVRQGRPHSCAVRTCIKHKRIWCSRLAITPTTFLFFPRSISSPCRSIRASSPFFLLFLLIYAV